jgi:UDP-N-acetyl-D-glucosamine dehydrogenase
LIFLLTGANAYIGRRLKHKLLNDDNVTLRVLVRDKKSLNPDIKNPRVLILGVAYKPGIGDVRETPVSELRDHLITKDAIVAWHDPLVPIWEGSEPVDLSWECDVAILATKQPGMDLVQLVTRGIQVLDCTNSIKDLAGVTSL